MSRKERARLEVMARVHDGQLTLSAASALLGVSYRQAKRIRARYARAGDGGLVHGLRGRRSNRKTDDADRQAVLKLYRAKYAGWGPTLACEYLAKEDGRQVSHDTLLRWLRAEGLFERRRKRGKHRSRRPRRRHRGELVQMDGSWHDWFEGRGGGRGPAAGWCCLMVLVDDATGTTWARFYDRETLSAAFDAFGRYAAAYGLPRALYVDKAGIYRPDDDGTPTQFGRAMKDLGVELILANSPQAKGRVERKNGTLQDRLVKELRLRGVDGMAAANALLDDPSAGSFLSRLNEKFRVAPARKVDLHRRPGKPGTGLGKRVKLDEVLCVHEGRAVGRDWCVQWRGRVLQVDAKHGPLDLPRPGRRVLVVEKADGAVLLRYDGQDLTWREVTMRPERPKPPRKPVVNNKRHTPPASHPWNRRPACARTASRREGRAGYAASALAAGPKAGDSSTAIKQGTVLLR